MDVSNQMVRLTGLVTLHQTLEFAALAAAVIAIPGPSVLFTVSRALTCGRRTALLNVGAVAAGTAGQWLARSPKRLAAIGGAGGLAMIGLGLTVAATGRRD